LGVRLLVYGNQKLVNLIVACVFFAFAFCKLVSATLEFGKARQGSENPNSCICTRCKDIESPLPTAAERKSVFDREFHIDKSQTVLLRPNTHWQCVTDRFLQGEKGPRRKSCIDWAFAPICDYAFETV
jgi:hypothetical protein